MWRNLRSVVASGASFSEPTDSLTASESHSASSATSSERFNQAWTRNMRSRTSVGQGWRPPPACLRPLASTIAIRSAQGTTESIWSRNAFLPVALPPDTNEGSTTCA